MTLHKRSLLKPIELRLYDFLKVFFMNEAGGFIQNGSRSLSSITAQASILSLPAGDYDIPILLDSAERNFFPDIIQRSIPDIIPDLKEAGN